MTIPRNGGRAPRDEAAFIAALKSGDDAAYEELVRTQGGRMLAVARRFLRALICGTSTASVHDIAVCYYIGFLIFLSWE